ncbi:MAG: hypothetical protein AAF585_03590 [Verrucomicrobiota bacterium]
MPAEDSNARNTSWFGYLLFFVGVLGASAQEDNSDVRANRISAAEEIANAENADADEFKTAMAWLEPLSRDDTEIAELRTEWKKRYIEDVSRLIASKFWNGNYSEAIELAAEICRPSLDPNNHIAQQLLEEYLEPSLLLSPQQMRRAEWVRAVIAMNYEDDAAYLYRLHGGYGDAGSQRFGELYRISTPETPEALATRAKLRTIELPELKFDETPLGEELQFLQEQSAIHDPDKQGIKIRVDLPKPGTKAPDGIKLEWPADEDGYIGEADLETPISLLLAHLKLDSALRYTTELGTVKYRVAPSGEVVVDTGWGLTGPFFDGVFRVPPNFAERIARKFESKAPADPFAQLAGAGTQSFELDDYLRLGGFETAPNTNLRFDGRYNLLFVRTESGFLEQLVDEFQTAISELRYAGFDVDPATRMWNAEIFGLTNPNEIHHLEDPADEVGTHLHLFTFRLPLDSVDEIRDPFAESSQRHWNDLDFSGIDFPDGASMVYHPTTSELVVRQTLPNLKIMAELIEARRKEAGAWYRSPILGPWELEENRYQKDVESN